MNAIYLSRKLDEWQRRSSFAVRRISEIHLRIEVTTPAGYVFASTWAADVGAEPTRQDVETAWRRNRRDFQAFDQAEGRYVG